MSGALEAVLAEGALVAITILAGVLVGSWLSR